MITDPRLVRAFSDLHCFIYEWEWSSCGETDDDVREAARLLAAACRALAPLADLCPLDD